MKSDLEQAKTLLEENHYTCVLCKDGQTYTNTERSVKPLLNGSKVSRILRAFLRRIKSSAKRQRCLEKAKQGYS